MHSKIKPSLYWTGPQPEGIYIPNLDSTTLDPTFTFLRPHFFLSNLNFLDALKLLKLSEYLLINSEHQLQNRRLRKEVELTLEQH